MKHARFPGLVLLVGALGGCSPAPTTRSEVNGKVTISGQLVVAGLVTFHGTNGQQATGGIRAGGEYTVADPPLGLCQITVKPVPANATSHSKVGAHAASHPGEATTAIPKKYEKPGNGLTHDTQPGVQTRNIDLTP